MTIALLVMIAALVAVLVFCGVLWSRLEVFRRAATSHEQGRIYLDQLVEHSPEAIVLVDPEDRVQRINKEFTRLFGYSSDEALGRYINDLIAPPDLRDEA